MQNQKGKFEMEDTSGESLVTVSPSMPLSHTRSLGTKQSPLQTDKLQMVPPLGRPIRKRCPILGVAVAPKAGVQAWWGRHSLLTHLGWPGGDLDKGRDVSLISLCLPGPSQSHTPLLSPLRAPLPTFITLTSFPVAF